MFLSGIFYPIDNLPALIQPVAQLLPLSFVVTSLREIAVNGATLLQIIPSIAGLLVWAIVALVLAIRLFVWKEVAV
jgi:ABC-2 type transport system permease protein